MSELLDVDSADPKMKTLILTISLALIANLQAEDLLVEQEETQTVRPDGQGLWGQVGALSQDPHPRRPSL